ncbi:hypothetical protein B0T24DRAFT_684590 [Lasiosphaeria ovina]|uniref:Uncharacterized protein n=1 Tax=Lasiosphaeria ovina TaxID=92902 RepID=A0AAE0MYA8_9PEZI|nr:hypothetical protein B0T24DRAFT_684590 [Lasiosphaeria ovina]
MDALPEPGVIADAFERLRNQSKVMSDAYNSMANAFDTLSVQSLRFVNVIAIHDQQIHALGQQMNQRINALEQQMNQRFEQMNQLFNTLENRFDILERRQDNFKIAAGDVPHFPPTHHRLFAMDNATADAIMPALGIHLAPHTPLDIKRESITRKCSKGGH